MACLSMIALVKAITLPRALFDPSAAQISAVSARNHQELPTDNRPVIQKNKVWSSPYLE
jgi:hypothetical protein